MASDSVSQRYAESAFDAAKAGGALDGLAAWLESMRGLVESSAPLQELLVNPDIEVPDKLSLLKRLLPEGWSSEAEALVSIVLIRGRAECLAAIAEDFQTLVDRERGLVRAVVRTARPLAPAVKTRLQEVLQQREGRRVALREESAPELLGGLQILLESRMIDGSLRTQLERLRRQLKQIRVHGTQPQGSPS